MAWLHRAADGLGEQNITRRGVLRRITSIGAVATVGAGMSELVGLGTARAVTPAATKLPATMVLNALPPGADAVRAAIEASCCITYTRDEGKCSPACGSGWCCYHVTSSDCGLNTIECIEISCAEGNFTTGC